MKRLLILMLLLGCENEPQSHDWTRIRISDSDFIMGSPVGDCGAFQFTSQGYLIAKVLDEGGPYMAGMFDAENPKRLIGVFEPGSMMPNHINKTGVAEWCFAEHDFVPLMTVEAVKK